MKKYSCVSSAECGASSMWDAQCEGGFDPALNANYFDQTTKQALNYGDISALDIEAPCFYTPDKCPTGTICYRKNEFWSQCKKSCEPGFHEGFGIYSLMPWACTPVTEGYLQTRKKITEVIEFENNGGSATPTTPSTVLNLACTPEQQSSVLNIQTYIQQNPALDGAMSGCLTSVAVYYSMNGVQLPSINPNNLTPLSPQDQINLAAAFAQMCSNENCENLIKGFKSVATQASTLTCTIDGVPPLIAVNKVIDTFVNPWNSGCPLGGSTTVSPQGKLIAVPTVAQVNAAPAPLAAGPIAGIAVGSVAFLIILVVLVVLLVRKNQSKAKSGEVEEAGARKSKELNGFEKPSSPQLNKMEGGVSSPRRQSPRRS